MIHEVIIWATVILIISLQIKIFLETKRKIKSYENIMINPQSFKVYKVFISEHELETIDSQNIINNLWRYSQNPQLKAIDEIETSQEDFTDLLFENNQFEFDLENFENIDSDEI
jgi:hypothetical protein